MLQAFTNVMAKINTVMQILLTGVPLWFRRQMPDQRAGVYSHNSM